MEKSFWSLIWSSFLRTQGALIGVIAIVLAVLLWCFSPDENILLGWALPIGFFCLILILTLSDAAYRSFKMSKHILPKVLVGRKPPPQNRGAKVLCLLEPSEIFSHDTLVSFYYIDEGNFECLIGIGTVINIQENGKIQVIMTHSSTEYENKTKKLAQNDAGILDKIRVKPNIPKTYLDEMMQAVPQIYLPEIEKPKRTDRYRKEDRNG